MSPNGGTAAALCYGITVRVIALAYFATFLSLDSQILGLAGARGIQPTRRLLTVAREHFGLPQSFWLFPTLFWVSASDASIQATTKVGALAAVSVVVGGPHTTASLLVCYLSLLSITSVSSAVACLPWDLLLLESSFLALNLPALEPLPSMKLSSAPAFEWCLLFRLLLFRVMFGFGKKKFLDDGLAGWTEQPLYLKAYLMWQPLPTKIAHWAHASVPDAVFRAALGGLFLVEVVMPPFLFLPFLVDAPAVQMIIGVTFIALQLGIAATGNYGTFQLQTIGLCAQLFAPLSFATRENEGGEGAAMLSRGIAVFLGVGGLVHLSQDSWTTLHWLYQKRSSYSRYRWWFLCGDSAGSLLVAWLRALGPFHIFHGFGVFSGGASELNASGHRLALEFTASVRIPVGTSTSGEPTRGFVSHRVRLPMRYAPLAGGARGQGCQLFAPYQPRTDHCVFYAANGCPLSLMNSNNPFYLSGETPCKTQWKKAQLACDGSGDEVGNEGCSEGSSHNPPLPPWRGDVWLRSLMTQLLEGNNRHVLSLFANLDPHTTELLRGAVVTSLDADVVTCRFTSREEFAASGLYFARTFAYRRHLISLDAPRCSGDGRGDQAVKPPSLYDLRACLEMHGSALQTGEMYASAVRYWLRKLK